MGDLILHIKCQWFMARVVDNKGVLASSANALFKGVRNYIREIREERGSRF